MAKFIDTIKDGVLVNLDHVVSTRGYRTDKGVQMTDLFDRKGDVLGTIFGCDLAVRVAGGLVPAPSGYSVVGFWYDVAEDDCFIDEEPIIAFEVGNTEIIPFTLNGSPAGREMPWAIKRPDGHLVDPYDRDWDDIDEFRAYQLKRARDDRKQNASKGGLK